MKKSLGFLRAQGWLVLLLASQSAVIADAPRGGRGGSAGQFHKAGGGNGGGGMKVMPRQVVTPSGGNFGGSTVKKFPGGVPSGVVPIKSTGPVFGPNVKPRLPQTNPFPGGTVSNGGIVTKLPGGKPKLPIVDPVFSGGPVKPKLPGGPIVTGPGKPKLPIIDPIFSGGPVKPKLPGGPIVAGPGKPKPPFVPIDPGIGNGKPGSGNHHKNWNNKFWFGGWGGYGGYGNPYFHNHPWWWHQHCWYPQWHGCYGGFNCPVIQPCPLPVYYSSVVTLPAPTVTVLASSSTVAVEAGQVDMAIMAVKVLDKGSPEQGMLFRVMIGNRGSADLTVPARLAVFAAKETQTTGELPRTVVTLPPVAAGKTVELDVRFPKTAHGYPMMIVAVEMPSGVPDANEQDNIAQGEIASLPGMEPDAQ
jgi:hypothetical protein